MSAPTPTRARYGALGVIGAENYLVEFVTTGIDADGRARIGDDDVLSLRLLQARDASLVGRPFWAHASATASWVDELEPHPSSDPEVVRAVWGERAVPAR